MQYHDRRLYNAMMTSLDNNIARLVTALKAMGVYNNTLIWFVSDNGGPIYYNLANITGLQNFHGGGGANNYPLTGGKITPLEGGMRVVSFAAGGAVPVRKTDYLYRVHSHSLTSTSPPFHHQLCGLSGCCEVQGVLAADDARRHPRHLVRLRRRRPLRLARHSGMHALTL